jgi:hypothetical protein
MQPANRQKHRAESAEYRARNQSKIIAQRKVRDAISQGKLKRESCSVCGEIKTHAHHADYSKPLNVTWLCAPHHQAIHSSL